MKKLLKGLVALSMTVSMVAPQVATYSNDVEAQEDYSINTKPIDASINQSTLEKGDTFELTLHDSTNAIDDKNVSSAQLEMLVNGAPTTQAAYLIKNEDQSYTFGAQLNNLNTQQENSNVTIKNVIINNTKYTNVNDNQGVSFDYYSDEEEIPSIKSVEAIPDSHYIAGSTVYIVKIAFNEAYSMSEDSFLRFKVLDDQGEEINTLDMYGSYPNDDQTEWTFEYQLDSNLAEGSYVLDEIHLGSQVINKQNFDFSDIYFDYAHLDENNVKVLSITNENGDALDKDITLSEDQPSYSLIVTTDQEIYYVGLGISNNESGINRGNLSTDSELLSENDGEFQYKVTINTNNSYIGDYTVNSINIYGGNGSYYCSSSNQNIPDELNDLFEMKLHVDSTLGKRNDIIKAIDFNQKGQELTIGDLLSFKLSLDNAQLDSCYMQLMNEEHFKETSINFSGGQLNNDQLTTYIQNLGNGHYTVNYIHLSIFDGSKIVYYDIDPSNLSDNGENDWTFTVTGSHDDFEAPEIRKIADENGNELTGVIPLNGENSSYSFYIYANEKLSNIQYDFSKQFSENVSRSLSFDCDYDNPQEVVDEQTNEKLYVYKYTVSCVPGQTYNGTYTSNYRYFVDEHENTTHIDEENKFSFQVNGCKDFQEKKVSVENIQYNYKSVYNKTGKVEVTFDLVGEYTQDWSGNYGRMEFSNNSINQYYNVPIKNVDGNHFKAVIDISNGDSDNYSYYYNGKYTLQDITVYDTDMNGIDLHLDAISFLVTGKDDYSYPPSIISFYSESGNNNEVVNENKTISYILVTSYDVDEDKISFGDVTSDEGKRLTPQVSKIGEAKYRVTFTIDQNSYNGLYSFRSITLSNSHGDSTWINFNSSENNGQYFLGSKTIEIKCGISDTRAPQLLKVWKDADNKDKYTDDLDYNVYFEFDEELSENSSINYSVTQNGNSVGYAPMMNLTPLGNNTYLLHFSKTNTYMNGHYQLTQVSFEDKYGNRGYYSLDNYYGSSPYAMFKKELSSINFDVEIDRNSNNNTQNRHEVSVLKYTDLLGDNVISETKHYELFEIEVDLNDFVKEFSKAQTYNINFYGSYEGEGDGNYIEIQGEVISLDENNHATVRYSTDIEEFDENGEYSLSDLGGNYDNGIEGYALSMNTESTPSTINVDLKNVTPVELKDVSFESISEPISTNREISVDFTMNKKIENMYISCTLDTDDSGYAYGEIEVEDITETEDGNYKYHGKLKIASVYNYNAEYYVTRLYFLSENDNEVCRYEDESLKNYKYSFIDEASNINIEVKNINQSTSIFKEPGTQSFLISANQAFEMDKDDISFAFNSADVNANIKFDLTQVSDHEYRVDIPIGTNMPNGMYFLNRSINYTVNGKKALKYLNVEYAFIVDCGIENYKELKINKLMEVDSNKHQYAVQLSKDVAHIKAVFENDKGTKYAAEISKDSTTTGKYFINIEPDETFESGYYQLSTIEATDEAGHTLTYEAVSNQFAFEYTNDLDQSDSDIELSVETKTVTDDNKSEDLERNNWTNKDIVLGVSTNKKQLSYKVSLDNGKTWMDYENIVDESGKLTIDTDNSEQKIYVKAVDEENQNSSNIVVVNVKVDKKDPQIKLTFKAKSAGVITPKEGYEYTIEASDKESGVRSVEYMLVEDGKSKDDYIYTLADYQDGIAKVKIPYTFSGTLYVRVTDNAGNVSEVSEKIEAQLTANIELNGSADSTEESDVLTITPTCNEGDSIQTVAIKKNGNDYEVIEAQDGKYSYTVTENATYTILVQTTNGAESTKTITYSSLGTSNVEQLSLSKTSTSDTIRSDTLNIFIKNKDTIQSVKIYKDDDKTGEDITSTYTSGYKITKNGTYKVVLTKTNGEEVTKSITYNNIYEYQESENVELELIYSDTGVVKNQTIHFIVKPSTLKDYKLTVNNGSGETDITDSISDGYTINENGTYTFTLTYNENGEEKTVTQVAKINNINNAMPELTLSANESSTEFTDKVGIQITGIQEEDINYVVITDQDGNEELINDYKAGYTIKKNGTYTIKVVAKNGNEATKTLVYNSLKAVIFEFTNPAYRLTSDAQQALEINNNINGTIEWTSNNEDVATVDENGTVTAHGEGTAIITAKITTEYGEYEATCTITVSNTLYELGDVNHDGVVNVTDLHKLFKAVLDGKVDELDQTVADFNQDGKINVTDIKALMNYILNK